MDEQRNRAADEARYFLILGRTVGKRENGDFLYTLEKGWVPDTGNEISDRLMGYDETEPADSPYKMFNESIMEQIEAITEAEATTRISKMNSN